MHFDRASRVFITLDRIARRMNDLDIPYALVGGMAMFQHGYRRFTEDVDFLVTRDSLKQIHDKLDGLGYLPPFSGSKNLKDTETGVKIEFLITGEYPGDGLPKPVSFPDPVSASQNLNGIWTIALPKLVELKLASGTVEWRGKDLIDVQEIIRELNLPAEFAEQIDESVRPSYLARWRAVQMTPPQE